MQNEQKHEVYDLACYKKGIECIRQFDLSTKKLPRHAKCEFAPLVRRYMLSNLIALKDFCDSKDPEENLRKVVEDIQKIFLVIRVMKDLNYFSPKKWGIVTLPLTELDAQVRGICKSRNIVV